MSIESKQLVNLSKIYQEAVYGKSPEQIEASKRKKDDLAGAPLTVTNADKKANTPAYQNLKKGVKGYKAADHLKNESAEHRRNPEGSIKDRFKSRQTDPSKDNFTGIGDSIADIMKQNAAMKKAAAKKTKKEEFVDEKVATGPRLGEPREKGATHMNAGEQGKISKRTKDWMDKKGQPGAPGGDAMKAREAEHRARRNVKKEAFVNWRQDLKEIPDYEEIPLSQKKRNEKISEKKVKNSVKINPEFKEEVEIISEKEVKVKDTRRTVDAIRAYDKSKDASRDATYDSDEGKKGKAKKEKEYAAKERGEIDKDDPNWKKKKGHTGMHGESYETKKTGEVISAFKRDPKVRKRFEKAAKKEGGPGSAKNRAADDMLQTAKDTAKRKGDTSKSDDRYAYESKLWDEVAENLTELGKLNNARFKVEGYQRDPEKGEAEAKKADKRSAKQKRMDSPDKGINSPAFKEFMRSRGM